MIPYKEIRYQSPDGLALYARDYDEAGADAPVILCLHGLTRNSADFGPAADYLAADYHLIVPDQRGRGKSDYDPDPSRYQPPVYCEDMVALLDRLGVRDVILLGTSMGGIMSMLLAAMIPERIRAVILNDIGPVIEKAGLERIKNYVDRDGRFDNLEAAAKAIATLNGSAFPDYGGADWLAFARRTCEETTGGFRLAYDPKIAEPFKAADPDAPPADLWPFFALLSAKPLLIVRGALSDLLSAETVSAMVRVHGQARAVEVPDRGHAPVLDEPSARSAITLFLRDCLQNARVTEPERCATDWLNS